MKEIKLTRGKFAIVDDDDYERVNKLKWSLEDSGKNGHELYYAKRLHPVIRGKKYVRLTMHKFIMGDIPEGMVIDHINLNGLDNRKENLRICTRSQNCINRGKASGTLFPYKGVFRQKRVGSFYARIRYMGKDIFSKQVRSPLEAAKLYNELALKYYGEYARLNDV